MADTFAVKPDRESRARLVEAIKRRVENCYKPGCWVFKNPNDTGQMYISKTLLKNAKHGRYVQIRRLIHYMAYNELPDMRRIMMRCNTPKCQNPAHTKIKGWSHDVAVDIEHNYITVDEVFELYPNGEKR